MTNDEQSKNYDSHSLSDYSVLSTTRTNRRNIRSIGEMKLKLMNLKKENLRGKNSEKNEFMTSWKSKFTLFLNSNINSNISNLMKSIENLKQQVTVLDSRVRSAGLLVDQTKISSKIKNPSRINLIDLKTKSAKPTGTIITVKATERNSELSRNLLRRAVTPTLQEIDKKNNIFSMMEYFFILVDNNGSLEDSISKLKISNYRTEVHKFCEKEFLNIKNFLFMIIGAEELFEKHFE